MFRLLPLAVLLPLLAGCDTGGPEEGALAPSTYHLASVDGRALPALVERTTEVCDSNPSRDYYWMVEVRGGTVVVDAGGRAEVSIDRLRMCETDGAERMPSRVVATGRAVADGRLLLDDTSVQFEPTAITEAGFTSQVSGAGLGAAARQLRFVTAVPEADPTGRWAGQAVFELDTTYAFRTSPDVLRRQQLYRRFDLELDLRAEGDSVLGTGRFVSYFERVTTNLQTGEVSTVGGRDVQQDDLTFPVTGTRQNQILTLRLYGQGVLLDWREGHPLVLDGATLRTGVRNYFEGSYYSTPSDDVLFSRP